MVFLSSSYDEYQYFSKPVTKFSPSIALYETPSDVTRFRFPKDATALSTLNNNKEMNRRDENGRISINSGNNERQNCFCYHYIVNINYHKSSPSTVKK